MDKLRALQYFIAAAEQGSFAAAARRMQVSVPAVHKLVSALEADLGVSLFERSAQGLALTASGERYLESCLPLVNELAAADEHLRRSAQRPSGTLVVGAHAQLAHHVLMPALPGFHARYPEIQIDLRVINRIGDADAPMIDVFLVHGWPEAPDLVHRQLGCTQAVIAASPEYLRGAGVPQHPRDLERHACIVMRNPNGTLIDLWEFERGKESVSVTVNGWLNSNAREAVLQAVLEGHGIGRFNALTTGNELRAGRLVPVLGAWTVQRGAPVNLLYRANHRRTPRVKAFIDELAELLRDFDAAGGTVRPTARSGIRAATAGRPLRRACAAEPATSVGNDRPGVDLELHRRHDEAHHLHGGAARQVLAEVLVDHLIDFVLIRHVLQVARDLHDIAEAAARCLDRLADLVERAARLNRGVVGEIPLRRVVRVLVHRRQCAHAGNHQQAAALDPDRGHERRVVPLHRRPGPDHFAFHASSSSCRYAAAQSALAPDSFATFAHLAMSFAIWSAKGCRAAVAGSSPALL